MGYTMMGMLWADNAGDEVGGSCESATGRQSSAQNRTESRRCRGEEGQAKVKRHKRR